MEEEYKFVKNIDSISSQRLIFTSRNRDYSDIKRERLVANFKHLLLKLFFIYILVFGIYEVIRTNALFMLIFILAPIVGFVCLQSYKKYRPVQKEVLLNKELDFIEFYDEVMNKKQVVYAPKAIKITVRIDSALKDFTVSLSVDVVGSLAQDKKLSNVRIVGFRYSTIENALSRISDAAIEFKFLADWLQLPMIVEECVYYYDTNTRHY